MNENNNLYKYDSDTNRTIELVLDVDNSQIIESDEFFNQPEYNIIKARSVLELSYRSGKSKFKCAICKQDVKIVGRRIFERNKTIYFFAHLPNSDDCPIKTDNKLSLLEILAKKYRGINEGPLHKRLKSFIEDRLNDSTSKKKGISNVVTEKTFKGGEITENQWRRPDVHATFKNIKLVFELQLSTTFLSVVVARDIFYNLNETYILWVFGSFNIEDQKLMEKDLYYAHKRNVFVLDQNAQTLSREKKELVLNCYWQLPNIVNNTVEIEWHHKMVTIDELTFDGDNFEVYYYNSDKDFYNSFTKEEQKILDEWENAKKVRWNLIYNNLDKKSKLQSSDRLMNIGIMGKLGLLLNNEKIVIHHELDNEENLTEKLWRVSKNDKWGFIDRNRREIIPIKYDEANCFNEGFARVELDGKYGFIDAIGNEIIPLKYDYAWDFIDGLARVELDGKYGFIDAIGNEIIPLKYDYAKDFIDGLAEVELDGKYGLIDKIGNEIVPLKYDAIEPYSEGLARVKLNGKYGFVNQDGIEAIPPEFWFALDFSDGLAGVQVSYGSYISKSGFIDKNGFAKIPMKYDEVKSFSEGLAQVKLNDKWGLIDVNEKKIVSNIYFFNNHATFESYYDSNCVFFINELLCEELENKFSFSNKNGQEIISFKKEWFSEGKASVMIEGKQYIIDTKGNKLFSLKDYVNKYFPNGFTYLYLNSSFSFIDNNRRKKIPFKCYHIEKFSSFLARVSFFDGRYNRFGVVDKSGREIIPIKYSYIGNFYNGLAKVRLNFKYGIVDTRGNIVIPLLYDEIKDFKDGLAIVGRDILDTHYREYGVVDKSGREITPLKYLGISDYHKGMAMVVKGLDGSGDSYVYGLIDKKGREILSMNYDYIFPFSGGLAKVNLNEKYGIINLRGETVTPLKYDRIGNLNRTDELNFCCGLIKVSLNKKYGFIDKNGREIIPIKYDNVYDFVDGLAGVNIDGKCGFIDTNGREIIPIKYDNIFEFNDGLAVVMLDHKYGFVDAKGNEVIPIKFGFVSGFSEGLAAVAINGKMGFIDKNGIEVIPFKFDYASDFSEGLAAVAINGKMGFIDKNGIEVIHYKYDYDQWTKYRFNRGMTIVSQNKSKFYIDRNGNRIYP